MCCQLEVLPCVKSCSYHGSEVVRGSYEVWACQLSIQKRSHAARPLEAVMHGFILL